MPQLISKYVARCWYGSMVLVACPCYAVPPLDSCAFTTFLLFWQSHSRDDGEHHGVSRHTTVLRWRRLWRRKSFRLDRRRGRVEQGLGRASASHEPVYVHVLVCNRSGGACEGQSLGIGTKWFLAVLMKTDMFAHFWCTSFLNAIELTAGGLR